MLNELITNIAKALDDSRIPYMIIGGQAVLLYGEPRLTKDIDITLASGIDRLSDIEKLSKKIGLATLTENAASFVKRTMVFPVSDAKSGMRVDFIFSFTEYESEAVKRAKSVIINEYAVKFAAVEDIIIYKIFAGRPRDIEDVKGIIYRNKIFDKKYVVKWLKMFDKSSDSDLTGRFQSVLSDLDG